MTYKIVLDSFEEEDGPFEVDANLLPVYASVDKSNLDVMRDLCNDINYNYDGHYVVVDETGRVV